jgi:hypothetical protein
MPRQQFTAAVGAATFFKIRDLQRGISIRFDKRSGEFES